MAVEQQAVSDFEAAVERARARAAATGELKPTSRRLDAVPASLELAEFVRRVLTDGTCARAVEEIGREDPNLASI